MNAVSLLKIGAGVTGGFSLLGFSVAVICVLALRHPRQSLAENLAEAGLNPTQIAILLKQFRDPKLKLEALKALMPHLANSERVLEIATSNPAAERLARLSLLRHYAAFATGVLGVACVSLYGLGVANASVSQTPSQSAAKQTPNNVDSPVKVLTERLTTVMGDSDENSIAEGTDQRALRNNLKDPIEELEALPTNKLDKRELTMLNFACGLGYLTLARLDHVPKDRKEDARKAYYHSKAAADEANELLGVQELTVQHIRPRSIVISVTANFQWYGYTKKTCGFAATLIKEAEGSTGYDLGSELPKNVELVQGLAQVDSGRDILKEMLPDHPELKRSLEKSSEGRKFLKSYEIKS